VTIKLRWIDSIVNDQTHWGWVAILLLIMLIMSLILLRWARKQG
jgi:hypothetical protein